MDTKAALNERNEISQVLHVALELGSRTWKVASTTQGASTRVKTLTAGNLAAFAEEISRAKERFGLAEGASVVSCYEAGRDGFWLHRWLISQGIKNHVVDSSSIEVNRRKRRAKTDRLDAQKLVKILLRLCGGEAEVCSVVNAPSVEAEDLRLLPREIERLKKERTQHVNRIGSKLALHGVACGTLRKLSDKLDDLKGPSAAPLPPFAKAEIRRECQRLELLDSQLKDLKGQEEELAANRSNAVGRKIDKMATLRGIGITTSSPLVLEFFAWRNFKNRRQVGALAGVVGTPYASDKGEREQGISKSGNKRVRWRMVQLAWLWLRYQPQSRLSLWFVERFGKGSKRSRRLGIVALARKLLVALWRFLEHGIVPEGALLK